MRALKHATKSLVLVLLWGNPAFCAEVEQGPIKDVSMWIEDVCPPTTNKVARAEWFESAISSPIDWRVFIKDGKVCAEPDREIAQEGPAELKLGPKAARVRKGHKFKQVDNGWLLGVNGGEFGGALFWYGSDGRTNYQISTHQVIDFISYPDSIYAIEGLAHMGGSHGSLIRIVYSKPEGQWKATSVLKLPFAPFAVSQRRDGTMLITLSDSLVAVGRDHELHTLAADLGWEGLYPGSSVLTGDEQKLYIGMRRFVGEFDLKANKVRFLIPRKDW